MPPATRLPRCKSSASLRPPTTTVTSTATPRSQPMQTQPSPLVQPASVLRKAPPALGSKQRGVQASASGQSTRILGDGTSSAASTMTPARSGIPTSTSRRRLPTSSSSSSISTLANATIIPAMPAITAINANTNTSTAPQQPQAQSQGQAQGHALRPVRSVATIPQKTGSGAADKPGPTQMAMAKPTAVRLTAARTGSAPGAPPKIPPKSRLRSGTVTKVPEQAVNERESERASPRLSRPPSAKLAPPPSPGLKRTLSRSPVLGGKRVLPPKNEASCGLSLSHDSTVQIQASANRPKSTKALIRPIALSERVFGGRKEKLGNLVPPPSPGVAGGSPTQAPVRSRLRASSTTSPPKSPRSPMTRSSSTRKPPTPKDKSLTASFMPRTPGMSERRARHGVGPSPRGLPETPALSTFLKDQSTRIGQIGEADISLASSTSFRGTPPRADGDSELDMVSGIVAGSPSPTHQRSRRATIGSRESQRLSTARSAGAGQARRITLAAPHRSALSPGTLSPSSPLSPRRARPLAVGTELRAELARIKNEKAVLETRIAALEAEEGRLTGLAEAAMRDRARALERAEEAESAREIALWDGVVAAADEAIEEERMLRRAIAAARAIVLAM